MQSLHNHLSNRQLNYLIQCARDQNQEFINLDIFLTPTTILQYSFQPVPLKRLPIQIGIKPCSKITTLSCIVPLGTCSSSSHHESRWLRVGVLAQRKIRRLHRAVQGSTYRLRKPFHCLNKAPRAWFHRFRSSLVSLSFTPSKVDASLFIFISLTISIIVCGNQEDLQGLIARLSTMFAMKDLVALHYFLGITAQTHRDGPCLTHTKYVSELLQ